MSTYKIKFEHWRVRSQEYMPREGKPPRILLMNNSMWFFIGGKDMYPRGGKTACHILKDGVKIATGWAVCSMADNFCYASGRKLATWRALKSIDFDIPREFAEEIDRKYLSTYPPGVDVAL